MTVFTEIRNNCIEVLQGTLKHPVLLIILCHAWIACSLIQNIELDTGWFNYYSKGIGYPVLAPLFALLSIFIERFEGRTKKWSWLMLPLYIGSCYLECLDGFGKSVSFHIICFAILPLCYLWIARAKNDISFIRQAAASLNSFVHALIYTAVPSVLTILILISIKILFGPYPIAIQIWLELFYFIVLLAVLFVSFDENGRNGGYVKLVGTILNWVISPALIIYALILYIYLIKIIVSWTLPVGGVATMVLSFSVILFLCKSYRRIQVKRTFNWFYGYSWLIAFPLFFLFWAGIFRRLSDYGCTSNRYYLVIFGLAMMVLSFRRKLKDSSLFYHYFCMILSCVLVLSISCPGISHKDVSLNSQRKIVMREAAFLGILDSNGKIEERQYSCKDSTDAASHRKVYKALLAMQLIDVNSCENYFALDDPNKYLERLPSYARDFATTYTNCQYAAMPARPVYLDVTDFIKVQQTNGFKYLFTSHNGYFKFDKLQQLVSGYDRSGFIEKQALKCGWDKCTAPPSSWLREHSDEMLTIETDNMRMVISDLCIHMEIGSGRWYVETETFKIVYILSNDENLIDRLQNLIWKWDAADSLMFE